MNRSFVFGATIVMIVCLIGLLTFAAVNQPGFGIAPGPTLQPMVFTNPLVSTAIAATATAKAHASTPSK